MSSRRQSIVGGSNEVFCELYSLQKLQNDKDFSLEQPHAYLIGRSKKNKRSLDGKVMKFKSGVINYKSEVFKNIFGKYDIPYRDVKQYIIYDDFPKFTIVFLEIDNERFYAFFDCLNPIQSQKFCDMLRNKLKFEMSENSLNLNAKSNSRRDSTHSELLSEPKQPSVDAQQLKSILKTNVILPEPEVIEKKPETPVVVEKKPEVSLVVEKKPETIVIVKSLAENDPTSRIRPESKIFNTSERTQFDKDRVPLFVEEFDGNGLKRVYYYSSKFLKDNPTRGEKNPQIIDEQPRFYDQNYTFSRRGYSGNSFEFDEPEEIRMPRTVQPRHKQQIILSPRIQRSQSKSYGGNNDYSPIRDEPFNYNLSRSSSMKRRESSRQSNRKSSNASSFSEFLNLDKMKNPYITHRNDI